MFIPQKVAERLKEYIRQMEINPGQRVFPISYTAARVAVRKAGSMVGMFQGCSSCGSLLPRFYLISAFLGGNSSSDLEITLTFRSFSFFRNLSKKVCRS